MKIKLAALLALGLFAVGCGDSYERTDISNVKTDGLGVSGVTVQRLDVHQGVMVSATMKVWNDDDEQWPMTIRAVDPSVVEIFPTVNKDTYAFLGKKEGSTILEITADEKVVVRIQAIVAPQPVLP